MRDWYSLLIMSLILVVGLAYSWEVRAQEGGDDDSAAVTPDEEGTEPVAVDTEDVMDPDAEVDTTDVAGGIDDLATNIKAVMDADDKTAKFMAIMALIAAVLKLALDLLRKYAKVLLGKKEVRVAALIVGLATFVTAYLATGAEWHHALLVSLGGPGAILITELSKMFKKDKDA